MFFAEINFLLIFFIYILTIRLLEIPFHLWVDHCTISKLCTMKTKYVMRTLLFHALIHQYLNRASPKCMSLGQVHAKPRSTFQQVPSFLLLLVALPPILPLNPTLTIQSHPRPLLTKPTTGPKRPSQPLQVSSPNTMYPSRMEHKM
jgi:hypothetical protein